MYRKATKSTSYIEEEQEEGVLGVRGEATDRMLGIHLPFLEAQNGNVREAFTDILTGQQPTVNSPGDECLSA